MPLQCFNQPNHLSPGLGAALPFFVYFRDLIVTYN